MRTLFIIVLVAFGVYACQQHSHHNQREVIPQDFAPEDITPLLIPLPLHPQRLPPDTGKNPGLNHLDTTWEQGPCGHWIGSAEERKLLGPCILV
jgi:hypothetical protein